MGAVKNIVTMLDDLDYLELTGNPDSILEFECELLQAAGWAPISFQKWQLKNRKLSQRKAVEFVKKQFGVMRNDPEST